MKIFGRLFLLTFVLNVEFSLAQQFQIVDGLSGNEIRRFAARPTAASNGLDRVDVAEEQTSWRWQNPWPQGNHLSEIWTFDSLSTIAAGDNATVVRTTDGGQSWNLQRIDSIDFFISISFVDRVNGWLLGAKSGLARPRYLYKTDNGGISWFRIANINAEVYHLHFVDSQNGWAVGGSNSGVVMKTRDGGVTWMNHSNGLSAPLADAFFIDTLTGWVVGYAGFIAKTTDGGSSWHRQFFDRPVFQLLAVYFANDSVGWCAGDDGNGYVGRTTNGGTTWTSTQVDRYIQLYDMMFFDEDIGAALGTGNRVYRSTNKGVSWSFYQTATTGNLYQMRASSESNGWAVGDYGFIVRTSNAGLSWPRVGHGTQRNLKSLKFTDSATGWAVGANGAIVHTTDGGEYWTEQVLDSLVFLRSVEFCNPRIGWAAGLLSRPRHSGILYKTTDGGRRWDSQLFSQVNYLLRVDFVDTSYGWMVGGSGVTRHLYKTTNGGDEWVLLRAENGGAPVLAVEFVDRSTGWLMGWANSKLMKTTDGGVTWQPKDVGINVGSISDVFFHNTLAGSAVGGYEVFDDLGPIFGRGYIYSTTNGGDTWITQDTTAPDMFNSVDFVDGRNGWAVGYRGRVYRTRDGGLHWNAQKVPSSIRTSFFAIDFVDTNNGWLCGDGGTILKTTNGGGTTGVKEPITTAAMPERITLEQNYPNPFNGTTVIDLELADKDAISLDVFDVVGRHVLNLLYGNVDAGRKKVSFDGTKLSSGVYFYKLRTSVGSITRKMILIR